MRRFFLRIIICFSLLVRSGLLIPSIVAQQDDRVPSIAEHLSDQTTQSIDRARANIRDDLQSQPNYTDILQALIDRIAERMDETFLSPSQINSLSDSERTDYAQRIAARNYFANLVQRDLDHLRPPILISKTERYQCVQQNEMSTAIQDSLEQGNELFDVTGTPGNVIIDSVTGQYILVAGAYPVETFAIVLDQRLSGNENRHTQAAILLNNEYNYEFTIGAIDTAQIPILIDDQPRYGPDNARLVIIEYADFACPFCQRHSTDETLVQIVDSYDNVATVFQHFAVQGENSERAAHAVSCLTQEDVVQVGSIDPMTRHRVVQALMQNADQRSPNQMYDIVLNTLANQGSHQTDEHDTIDRTSELSCPNNITLEGKEITVCDTIPDTINLAQLDTDAVWIDISDGSRRDMEQNVLFSEPHQFVFVILDFGDESFGSIFSRIIVDHDQDAPITENSTFGFFTDADYTNPWFAYEGGTSMMTEPSTMSIPEIVTKLMNDGNNQFINADLMEGWNNTGDEIDYSDDELRETFFLDGSEAVYFGILTDEGMTKLMQQE